MSAQSAVFGFPAAYEAEFLEEQSGTAELLDYRHPSGTTAGAPLLVRVRTTTGNQWAGRVWSRELGIKRSVTGIYSTPNPDRMAVVARGDVYLIDAREPSHHEFIDTKGPVTAVKPIESEGLLLLSSPWRVTALGKQGRAWQTERLAIDGIRLDEVDNGRLAGVADPDDEEPHDFVVDLRTGRHEGGFSEGPPLAGHR